MVNEGQVSISRCLEEVAAVWRPSPLPLPEEEFDPDRVRSEMDELANEVGLNAAEVDYLTEYFMGVERLNLSKASYLFFDFCPLTVSGARLERREILALITQVREEGDGPVASGSLKQSFEDEWPYLSIAASEGAGYAISLQPQDRGAVFFYDTTLLPLYRLDSLQECINQIWRGVIRREDTRTGRYVSHDFGHFEWGFRD